MKKLFPLMILLSMLTACGNEKPKEKEEDYNATALGEAPANTNEGRGLGEVKEVTLKTPLEQDRIGRGLAIYEMKCSACHKLTGDRVVGPGWKDVTKRRQPEW